MTGAILREIERDGRRVTALRLVTRYGDVTIRAEGFAHCSGGPALAYLAGFECRGPDEKIYGSQQAVIEGIRTDVDPPSCELSERIAEKADAYGFVRRNGWCSTIPGSTSNAAEAGARSLTRPAGAI